MRRIRVVLALTWAILLLATSPAWATDRYASPSGSGSTCSSGTPCSLATAVTNSASFGDRVLLKSGSYGTWTGALKSVTLLEDAGASASIALDFNCSGGCTTAKVDGPVIDGLTIVPDANGFAEIIGNQSTWSPADPQQPKNITIKNSDFGSTPVNIDGLNAANILFDNDTWSNVAGSAWVNAAIGLHYGDGSTDSGVTVQNSSFSGGDADGVHTGAGIRVLNNEFANLVDVGGNHTDAIQFDCGHSYCGAGSVIDGNWVHSSSAPTQGITAYDCVKPITVTNNVVDIPRAWGIELYCDQGSTVQHNTLIYRSATCYAGGPCGKIGLDAKAGDTPGTTSVKDNIHSGISAGSGASASPNTNNICPGCSSPNIAGDSRSVTFVGGSSPTTYAGYALDCGSLGEAAASDGLNVGAITGGEPSCTPSPFLTDSATDTTGTTLASHTGELGATWAKVTGNTPAAQITAAGRVRATTADANAVYYASGTPPDADYKVEADVYVASQPTRFAAGPIGRVDTSTGSYYHCRFNKTGGGWELWKFLSNSGTQLGSTSAATLTTGSTYHEELDMQGSTISCKVGGVTKVSVTDTSITAAGKAGLRMHSSTVSDAAGLHVDNLSATGL